MLAKGCERNIFDFRFDGKMCILRNFNEIICQLKFKKSKNKIMEIYWVYINTINFFTVFSAALDAFHTPPHYQDCLTPQSS